MINIARVKSLEYVGKNRISVSYNIYFSDDTILDASVEFLPASTEWEEILRKIEDIHNAKFKFT